MPGQDVGNDAPDTAEADDHDLARFAESFSELGVGVAVHAPPGDTAELSKNRSDGQPERGHDLPEGRRFGADQLRRRRRTEHDQRRFRRRAHQHTGFGGHARPVAGEAQQ